MKNLLCASVALTVLAGGPALATDLAVPVKAPVYKAMPIKALPLLDPWTGFYVGANGGYGWAKWDSSSVVPGTTASSRLNGWSGGVQAGYNWKLDQRWLAGVEADMQITGQRAKRNSSSIVSNFEGEDDSDNIFSNTVTTDTSNSWKLPWFATFRGRLGLLWDPQTLLYATGGPAVGKFTFFSQTTTTIQELENGSPTGAATVSTSAFSQETIRAGGAIGAGLERKFTQNWSAKLEYLYLDFGSRTFLSGTGSDTHVRLNDQIVRLGINYAFDR